MNLKVSVDVLTFRYPSPASKEWETVFPKGGKGARLRCKRYGRMAQWLNGSMAQWLNGSMAQCVKFSRLRLFGTFAVLALGLSGCTSAVEDVASTSSDIFEPVRAFQFPLDEYLALIDDIGLSDEDIIRQFERNNLREDELVTQCNGNVIAAVSGAAYLGCSH